MVTFDQPLYIKAISLTKAQNSDVADVFVRLGTFHLMMSILASIGHIMKRSGLEEVIGQCYSELTVRDISKGKAFNRAIRAHSIVHRALYHLLLEEKIDSIFSSDEKILLNNYYDRLADSEDSCEVADLEEQLLFERLIETIHEAKMEQTGGERTGNLKKSILAKKHILTYLAAGD